MALQPSDRWTHRLLTWTAREPDTRTEEQRTDSVATAGIVRKIELTSLMWKELEGA